LAFCVVATGCGEDTSVQDAAQTPEAAAGPQAPALTTGSRPNVLLIVADDLGYLDLGVYGSEIRTPNIDALASSGVILTNFYTSISCQPTRAMLMSGADNHLAGVGAQGRVVEDNPYYRNYLSERVVTLAERMRAEGYRTYMAGKWHLGSAEGQTPAERGFDRSFVLLDPGASHFGDMTGYSAAAPRASYRDDGAPVESLPGDFYSTIAYTDRVVEYANEAAADDAPFFAYLAYTAPHWPIHALPEDMEKTRGRYDEGWDVIRERRLARWRELGFGVEGSEPGFVESYTPWDSLSDETKTIEARKMEAYAAMVERMDAEIGRLVESLRASGKLDNTLILFMSDNGGEYLGNDWAGMAEYFATFDNTLENIGRPGSYLMPGPGWGEAATAPFYLAKGFMAEGGIHVPAFVNGPGLEPSRNNALIAAFDLAPTFLELAGADPATLASSDPDVQAVTGRSFAAALRGEDEGRVEAVSFEIGGQRAVRRGDWKALYMAPPNGTGSWQLFNLADDPAETNDMAAGRPDLLAELVTEWDRYAAESGVLMQ
jgi:arylsulfatase